MDKIRELFLKSLKASLKNSALEWDQSLVPEEWEQLFRLAKEHSVLPIVYDGVYRCHAFAESGSSFIPELRKMSIQSTIMQVQKTQYFLEVYQKLGQAGLYPVVVKGLVCRNLYPNPDLRASNDEDIYIPSAEYEQYQQLLTSYGFVLRGSESNEGEAEYINPKEGLMIELHRDLMDMELSAIADMNVLFEGALARTIELEIEGNSIRTLCHTDHLLFLILHALKHFVTGGFGIRQVLDILIFSETYGAEIDWNSVMSRCEQFHADQFALAMLEIGQLYFDYDYQKAAFPVEMHKEIDPMPLLEDLLDAGIYGASSMSRKHSAGITLNTLQAQHEGKKSRGMLASLFPKASALEERFSYLKKMPWLLPLAWVQRIFRYVGETREEDSDANSAVKALQIGNERVELMRKYGIIR